MPKDTSFLPFLAPVSLLLMVGNPLWAQGDTDESRTKRDFTPRRVLEPQRALVDSQAIRADEVTDQVVHNELVLGVEVNGEARAYPINMLNGPRREIVNDTLGGRAIAATW